jgi:CubicO group peptidase (beta-lactamase class C family)
LLNEGGVTGIIKEHDGDAKVQTGRGGMKKALGVIFLVIVLGIGGFVAMTWPWPKLAFNAAYGPPPGSPPDVTTLREPIEKVPGDYRPLPVGSRPDLDFSEAVAINEKYDGYSLMIWQANEVIFEKYFAGGSPDTRAESASMHKSVMSTLMGVAIADGLVGSLEDPIGKYIPEWKDDPRGKMTIHNVLNMATGLAPLSMEGGVLSANSRFQQGLFMRSLTLSRAQVAEPGTVFDYRNQNSQLGGMIIEAATKRRYADYLSEKIWKPIGAKDAYVWLDKAGGMPRTSGTLMARTEDWMRIGILLKDGGQFEGRQVVPTEWVEKMIAPSATNPNYGLQVWRASPYVKQRWYNATKQGASVPAAEEWVDPDIFFFDGFGGQRVYVSRAENLVIVRQGKARPDWDDSALPNAVIRVLRAAKPAL